MADRVTIARPYARAAFRQAQAGGTRGLAAWSGLLNTASLTVSDARVKPLLGSPVTTPEQLAKLVLDVAQAKDDSFVDDKRSNFVRTLADNRRLGYLPEIAALFDRFKDEAEGTVDVTVTSAAALSQAERDNLADSLAKRFNRRVRVHAQVDPALIGGAVIRAGDLVIDGSLKSKLERLAYELTA
jgi:F-type H+-transporting ATPase subunit delta